MIMNRNLIIILLLLTHTATPMMAMRRGLKHMKDNPWVEQVASENEKIEVLLAISTALPLSVPLTDELLLKENAWWQDVRNWPQDEKTSCCEKLWTEHL